MTNVLWHDRIQDEMIWHLSAKQALNREESPELWALAEGNSRGLKKAQKSFYHSTEQSEAMNTLYKTVETAIRDYKNGKNIIDSQDKELAALFTEGYVQGLLRAWSIASNDSVMGDGKKDTTPPEDLSSFGYKKLTEVT